MNKYRAKRTVCTSQHNHASMAEAARCDYWALMKRAGKIAHYDTQPVVDLPCGRYRPDFCIWRYAGDRSVWAEFEDVKGMATREFIRIRKTFDAVHPAAPLRVVRRHGKGWKEI